MSRNNRVDYDEYGIPWLDDNDSDDAYDIPAHPLSTIIDTDAPMYAVDITAEIDPYYNDVDLLHKEFGDIVSIVSGFHSYTVDEVELYMIYIRHIARTYLADDIDIMPLLFERFTFNNMCKIISELQDAMITSTDDVKKKILFYMILYMYNKTWSLMPLRTQIITYQMLCSKIEKFMPVADYSVFLHLDNRLIPNIELMGIL